MYTIRPETPDDAAAIAAVHVRAWQGGYRGLIPDETLGLLNPAAWAQRRRDNGTADPDHPFRTLLACDAEGTAGFTTFGPYRIDQDSDRLDHAYGEVLALYVDPARWGRGVGAALFAAARAGLAERGWTELRLWVLEDNHRARGFYERAGLVADGERSTYQIKRSAGRPPLGLVEVRYRGRLDQG
ncbi:GNAT family N-acetyltransferase [Plantactinospora siamensis]|uniref:GNAT family N-acetyltransferase n=1 Tax=Plantactinospora siamensis TaxID=555372 RepID=A0ABV6NSP4_9ACTN